jgi:transposase
VWTRTSPLYPASTAEKLTVVDGLWPRLSAEAQVQGEGWRRSAAGPDELPPRSHSRIIDDNGRATAARSGARTRGKPDPIDALAVARAALREPDLPAAVHDDVSRELKLLVYHREDLLAEPARMINRLRWHLHELDPELELPARRLGRLGRLDRLVAWLGERRSTAVPGLVVRLALELVADVQGWSVRINALEREIAQPVEQVAPQLLELPGCAALTAAKIVGATANWARFRSEACFVMHAGVAPIPASSGRTQCHRLARGGNRQLNAALHRIALTQIGMSDSLGRSTTNGGARQATHRRRPCERSSAVSHVSSTAG